MPSLAECRNNFNFMDNLKSQTQTVLSKVLQEISKEKQEDEKNQLPHAHQEPVPTTCKELIDLYSVNLDAKQKMLLEITLANDLLLEMSTTQLKQRLTKTVEEMSNDNNQFNIPESELPASLMNKSNKVKKDRKAKRTEPSVESNPQYFRVDLEICNKLFNHYKALPLGLPNSGGFNFEEKEHHKNSMNYHKILEIFKDAKLNVEINQKLLILRSIKKFCFNQNFISNQEFIKVFKVIVHGLGFKEQIFEEFAKKNSLEKQKPMKPVNSVQKNRRNYRFKTDNSLLQQRTSINESNKHLNDISMGESKRGNDRKIVERASGKKIGGYEGNSNPSYLAKAMQNQKISKITWQSLFNMKQSSMHSFIVVPSFVRNANLEQF